MSSGAGNFDSVFQSLTRCCLIGSAGCCSLKEYFICRNSSISCHGISTVTPKYIATDRNDFSISCDCSVIQFNGCTALCIKLHISATAISNKYRTVCQIQCAVFHSKGCLTFLTSCLITFNKYLSLYCYISSCRNNRLCTATISQISIGKVINMRINCCIFQNRSIFHTKLSTD